MSIKQLLFGHVVLTLAVFGGASAVSILLIQTPIFPWLVFWNMTFIFHNIWDVILPIDEILFFKMGRSTTNQSQSYQRFFE
jgi:hypothetical protein